MLRHGPALSWPTAAALITLCGSAGAGQPCQPANGFAPVCGFQRPEDIEILPGGQALLISEYGTLTGALPGRLTLWQPRDGRRRTLYPAPDADGNGDWGAPDCPGPAGPTFAPHGIHHGPAAGLERVYAVNHGTREAVEIFELSDGGDPERARLRWRGCVPAPAGVWMNDVVGLPGGGFAVTHMIAKGSAEETFLETERTRAASGHVLTWTGQAGWRRLPGTDGALPNGIEIADDGATLYINEYLGDRVYAYDRAREARLWQTAVDAPDNSSWGEDGRLLVASHHEDLRAIIACNANAPATTCPVRYSVVAIEAAEGRRLTVIEGGGAPLGGATVAAELNGMLYLGSFVGDRLVYAPRGTGLHP